MKIVNDIMLGSSSSSSSGHCQLFQAIVFLTIVLQTSLSLVTFISFVIVISAGSLNTSSFTLPLRSFSMTFNQVVFAFPLFLFVLLSASCNDILAGVSGGSLMR